MFDLTLVPMINWILVAMAVVMLMFVYTWGSGKMYWVAGLSAILLLMLAITTVVLIAAGSMTSNDTVDFVAVCIYLGTLLMVVSSVV